MRGHDSLLNILDKVDSTNNYAMQRVYAGMAKHGEAYFSANQTAGKGQRGKHWMAEEGKNIALSIIVRPKQLTIAGQFYLSAAVSLGCYDFLYKYTGDDVSIKWPNDIYWRDRKAGGILIENALNGADWKWAVVGVGININQTAFSGRLKNAVSLKQITGKEYDPAKLAHELYNAVLIRVDALISEKKKHRIIKEYNLHLYKKDAMVKLKKGNMTFETLIKGVASNGQLLTKDSFEKHYNFGDVEWLL
jgi:BirA family transcriptional regulator, biotin operon repressor / biotin---[acetyl-CoA-carboxylase] ligase